MKLTKSSIALLTVSCLLAFSPTVEAQTNSAGASTNAATPPGPRGRGMNVDLRLEALTTQLSLTDAQKPKVKAVLEEQQAKFAELRGATPEQRQAYRQEVTAKMKAILTPEQFTKYEALPQRGQGQGRRGEGGSQTNRPAAN